MTTKTKTIACNAANLPNATAVSYIFTCNGIMGKIFYKRTQHELRSSRVWEKCGGNMRRISRPDAPSRWTSINQRHIPRAS
ncbi:hypothetical protein BJV77DRAFT_1034466 [Russula vinacea]|nr:hypothetical protein BJV77DRAFT_1034466 [Russula vinacea]